ncbi:MAG: hypothetical protein H6719_15470 [Sandaracinaceae bacterium]|nr:hypothetical protein [Sandaracinaceae bacterium]
MSEDSAVRAFEKWERNFFISFFAAIALLVAQVALEWDFLDYPRAAAWVCAGVSSLFVARAQRRLRRDGSWAFFRGLACFGIALLAIL